MISAVWGMDGREGKEKWADQVRGYRSSGGEKPRWCGLGLRWWRWSEWVWDIEEQELTGCGEIKKCNDGAIIFHFPHKKYSLGLHWHMLSLTQLPSVVFKWKEWTPIKGAYRLVNGACILSALRHLSWAKHCTRHWKYKSKCSIVPILNWCNGKSTETGRQRLWILHHYLLGKYDWTPSAFWSLSFLL